MILIAFLFFQWTNPAFADRGGKTTEKRRLVPAPLLKWQENGSPYAVLVEKSTQKVFLYHRDDLFTPFRVYKASTGENDGPKSRINDRKTPEGIYFFTSTFSAKDLSPIYGTRALPIDYPNPLDKREGRGGYGIWFHGSDKPLKPKDSNGCVALDNHNIDELDSYIKLYDTPIIISEKIEMIDPEKQKKDARELEQIVESWRKAWEEKKIEGYISFYGSKFSSNGKNRQQWKKYKARLARKYKKIRVENDNLELYRNDGIVLAKFTQKYSTAGFESRGEKRLYLRQNSDEWKITGEFFKQAEEKQVASKKVAVKRPRLYNIKDIKNFIYSWKKAWEQKDIKVYISHYDAKFRSRGMGLGAWEKHRERLNNKFGSLKIEISDLKIVRNANRTAEVSFNQSYRADEYHDQGLKKILLIKKGKHWKIKKEEWRSRPRGSRR